MLKVPKVPKVLKVLKVPKVFKVIREKGKGRGFILWNDNFDLGEIKNISNFKNKFYHKNVLWVGAEHHNICRKIKDMVFVGAAHRNINQYFR